jgi:hypothetical protein
MASFHGHNGILVGPALVPSLKVVITDSELSHNKAIQQLNPSRIERTSAIIRARSGKRRYSVSMRINSPSLHEADTLQKHSTINRRLSTVYAPNMPLPKNSLPPTSISTSIPIPAAAGTDNR